MLGTPGEWRSPTALRRMQKARIDTSWLRRVRSEVLVQGSGLQEAVQVRSDVRQAWDRGTVELRSSNKHMLDAILRKDVVALKKRPCFCLVLLVLSRPELSASASVNMLPSCEALLSRLSQNLALQTLLGWLYCSLLMFIFTFWASGLRWRF